MLYNNNMQIFQYVEDYLEYLGGYEVGIPTKLLAPPQAQKISLARYDISIIDNMSASTVWGTALTDKQSELVVKLVLKYRKQFAKNNIDVSPVEHPQFRLPIRKIDRSKTVKLINDSMAIRFPYDTKLINEIQEVKGISQGSVRFERDTKTWYFGITEYNVNWVITWAQAYGFDIDQKILTLLDQIIECEKHPYKIELIKQNNEYTVTNAPSSLLEYLDQHGGLNTGNIVKLIDHSGICGYQVDQKILQQATKQYGQSLSEIGEKHSIHIKPSPKNLNMIFDYAELTDRYPICIYNPTLFDINLNRFDEKDIVRFDRNGKTKTSEYNPYDVKIIYAHKIPATWNFPVPLLVTTFEMMFGGRKMDWTRKAEKIIYYGATRLKENA